VFYITLERGKEKFADMKMMRRKIKLFSSSDFRKYASADSHESAVVIRIFPL